MTQSVFDFDSFKDVSQSGFKTESLSEILEQESRRYSRKLSEEDEARVE
jgi:hypothetical protein